MGDEAGGLLTYRGAVYPWHCDHMGHMNVMWYVARFDEAAWNLFAAVGLTPSYLRGGRFGMAGLQQNITYKRELFAGDVIDVRSRVLEIGDKRIRFEGVMRNIERDEVAAICDLTATHMDRTAHKSAPFPPAVRQAAEALMGQAR